MKTIKYVILAIAILQFAACEKPEPQECEECRILVIQNGRDVNGVSVALIDTTYVIDCENKIPDTTYVELYDTWSRVEYISCEDLK